MKEALEGLTFWMFFWPAASIFVVWLAHKANRWMDKQEKRLGIYG